MYRRDRRWCCRYPVNGKYVRTAFDTKDEAVGHLAKVRRMEREGELLPRTAKGPLLGATERQQRSKRSTLLLTELVDQPMGFYTPAVLVKDAQRHGLRVKPVNVQISEMTCTVEHEANGSLSLRLGLNYARTLKASTASLIVASRNAGGPFLSVKDLALRVPALNRSDLAQLARIGALNALGGVEHRRDAIWQIEQVGRPVGPLLRQNEAAPHSTPSPLRQMKTEERLIADYAGTGLTTGPHPMAYRREELRRMGILSARELQEQPDGVRVCAAGAVIARQRPGTALGFIFLSMEDETGIANIIIHPQLYERERVLVTRGKFLKVYGKLQNQEKNVVHVKSGRVGVAPDLSD